MLSHGESAPHCEGPAHLLQFGVKHLILDLFYFFCLMGCLVTVRQQRNVKDLRIC